MGNALHSPVHLLFISQTAFEVSLLVHIIQQRVFPHLFMIQTSHDCTHVLCILVTDHTHLLSSQTVAQVMLAHSGPKIGLKLELEVLQGQRTLFEVHLH